jgi:cytochrome c
MKWLLIFASLFFIVLMPACETQSKKSNKPTPTDSLVNYSGRNVDSPFQEGAHLIAVNDCLTCHKLDSANFGPSYNQISEKYTFGEGNIENLSHSIIHGSKGLYGLRAMTPHPNVSWQDAKVMATYILALKHEPNKHSGNRQ